MCVSPSEESNLDSRCHSDSRIDELPSGISEYGLYDSSIRSLIFTCQLCTSVRYAILYMRGLDFVRSYRFR